MGFINLIFLLFVLFSTGNAKRVPEVETLIQLLKEQFESYSQDDQIIASPPESHDLSSDEDVNLDFSNKGFDDFGLINDDYDEDDLKNSAELSIPMCGKPKIEPDVNQKIVGGKPARPHSWPWQVSLQIKMRDGKYKHFCGGSIISNNIVLTAAHCLDYGTSNLLVVASAHNFNKSESVQKSKIKTVIRHNDYIDNETHFINDIAVLIMDTPFTFNDKISPVCLPKKNSIASGTCYATGWGRTYVKIIAKSLETGVENILNQVRLPVVEQDVCAYKVKQQINLTITSSHLCGGIDGRESTCYRDSGGPFVCLDANDKLWYLHGITSFGNYCKPISVFTRVAYFLEWIKDKTGLSID